MNRPLGRAALLAYGIGVAASMAAALVNGIIVPALASRYPDVAAAPGQLGSLLRLCWSANQALADAGEVGRCVGVVLWSGLILRSRSGVALGVFGLVAGAVPALAILLGLLRLDLHGAMLALLVAAAWNLALAVRLVRGTA
jgi:hypothetical protein